MVLLVFCGMCFRQLCYYLEPFKQHGIWRINGVPGLQHVAGSINIPLNEIPGHLDKLKHMGQVVLCCASGGRRMQASMYLKQNGIESSDGGSWLNVNNIKNN